MIGMSPTLPPEADGAAFALLAFLADTEACAKRAAELRRWRDEANAAIATRRALEKDLAEREGALDARAAEVDRGAKENIRQGIGLAARESALAARTKAADKEIGEWKLVLTVREEDFLRLTRAVEAREASAREREAEAKTRLDEAEALRTEYLAKVAQLRQAIG